MRYVRDIGKYYRAGRHIPFRSILSHVRRKHRERRYLRVKTLPAENITNEDIRLQPLMAGALMTRKITASTFAYDSRTNYIIFKYNDDKFSLLDLNSIQWTSKNGISAEDVNRCYFISFMEFSTLVDGDSVSDIKTMYAAAKFFDEIEGRATNFIPIPWQPLPMARRLVNIMFGLALLENKDDGITAMPEYAYLRNHITKLYTNISYLREDDLGYNHLASEIFAQCLYARMFLSDSSWKARSGEFLACMQDQLGVDGLQLERSATYQCHVLGHVDILIASGAVHGSFLAQMEHVSHTMKKALQAMIHPDGQIAVFNDAAVGDGPTPESLGVFPDRSLGHVHLTEGGFIAIRNGEYQIIFDSGPCGPLDMPGHAHADFLSVEISIGQSRLIVDPGVATYKAGDKRVWTKSAATHNGPHFLGQEPIEFFGAFRVGRRGEAHFFDRYADRSSMLATYGGWHDGYAQHGGMVSRFLAIETQSRFTLTDIWISRTPRDAQSYFLIPQDVITQVVSASADTIVLHLAREKKYVRITSNNSDMLLTDRGVNYQFGPKKPCPSLELTIAPSRLDDSTMISSILFEISHSSFNARPSDSQDQDKRDSEFVIRTREIYDRLASGHK